MREINPFSVLGLAPSAIRDLNDTQIDTIIDGIFRAQMKIHHQDKGGSRRKNEELNWAREELDRSRDPVGYEDWKEQFLKTNKTASKKMRELDSLMESALTNQRALQDSLASIWGSFIGEGIFESEVSALNPPPTQLLLSNTPEDFLNGRAMGNQIETERDTCTFVSLKVLGQRKIERTLLKREWNRKVGPPPADTPKQWIFDTGITRRHHHLRPIDSQKPELLEGLCLIGSLGKYQRTERIPKGPYPLLLPEVSPEAYVSARNGFSWESFRPCAQYLRPVLGQYQYPVAIKKIDGEIRFVVLGYIVRIEVLS